MHKQTTITIDGQEVEVDENIAPLLCVLNTVKGIRTIQSCEGTEVFDADVFMEIEDGEDRYKIADRLFEVVKDIGLGIDVNLEWSSSCYGDNGNMCRGPVLILRFPKEHMVEVTEACSDAL